MKSTHDGDIDWYVTTWEGHRRVQLEMWARLSLDEVLEAQEEMADLLRELAPRAAGTHGPAPGGD